jgi:hypothetical protein
VRGERIEFMIIIIIGNATVLPNASGSTVAFPMLREPLGNLMQLIFCDFFLTFFL